MSIELFTSTDAAGAADACARHILQLVENALSELDRVSLAVSGGSTPKLMFQRMAAMPFPWDKVHLFFVDERCVPPTDSASNYKLAEDNLLRAANIPASHVHRIAGELPPAEAAERYAADLRDFFGQMEGEIPEFDIVHRGMGPDAHTASLFPGSPLIDDHTGTVGSVFAPQFDQWRVTLLPSVLEAARHTVLLVAGEDKADAIRAVFKFEYNPKKYPVQIGNDGEDVAWFLDEHAAEGLR